jgi:hypothetical protein
MRLICGGSRIVRAPCSDRGAAAFATRPSHALFVLTAILSMVAVQTPGMGLSLGSHKANTLPITLLSNTGIIGFFALSGS